MDHRDVHRPTKVFRHLSQDIFTTVLYVPDKHFEISLVSYDAHNTFRESSNVYFCEPICVHEVDLLYVKLNSCNEKIV